MNSFRGLNNTFIGQDGDIVYSKNNVCIHDVSKSDHKDTDDSIEHIPGYLTLQCQSDDILGVTLILQWLPNATLEKNPRSIRSVSQKNQTVVDKQTKFRNINKQVCQKSPTSENDINVEMNGDMITVTSMKRRPDLFMSST
ncbi:unnamed protein product [Brugia timori]|uniref:Small G protein signalling modulator 1/2 Rab-binding domain-containing protein n=1 Tax=Brugia timori TaxID=42155 RepID=A0A3P7SSB5_9BILA|nr:unnamed protein product [Brugia timori]